jgi:branched-chain amino acid transport system permease protein
MIILGGINTRLGPIVGAVFISLFPTVVSINPLWQESLDGAIFIVVIIFLPEGFVGLIGRLGRLVRDRWLDRFVASAPASTSASPVAAPIGAVQAGNPSTNHSGPAVEARGITFSYGGGLLALDDVDLVVSSGSIHGLIGPNGSGKSTMVAVLSGMLHPQAGTVTIHGHRADSLAVWQRADLGVMRTFQTAVMVQELTTAANVSVGLYRKYPRLGARSLAWPAIPSARRDSRAMAATSSAALGSVGLGPRWALRRVADIPHGVEQLTQLAAACVGQPTLLILDEPLAGLSSEEVEEVARILRSLRESDVTTIVIEHQTRFIFDTCDDVTVLAAGHLVHTGTAADVRNDPRVREVYLGQ